LDRLDGHERGDGDGRSVRDLRHARLALAQADGLRARGGGAHRRDGDPCAASAGDDDAARRAQLVAPAGAWSAAEAQPRRDGRGTDNAAMPSRPPLRRTARALAWAVLLLDLFVVVVWAASGGSSFWPVWVWLGTGLVVASVWWLGESTGGFRRLTGQVVLISL